MSQDDNSTFVGAVLDGEGKGWSLGRHQIIAGKYTIELREAIWHTRFGKGLMYIDKFFRHSRAIIFCISEKPRENFNLSQAQGGLRPLLNEYFLHQAPVLILYEYHGRRNQLPPEELGRALAISEIGTDNPWHIHCWKGDIIKEMKPGLDWLVSALDTYFQTIPENFRTIRDHPLVKEAAAKAQVDEKGNLRPISASPPSDTKEDLPPRPNIAQMAQNDENRCAIS